MSSKKKSMYAVTPEIVESVEIKDEVEVQNNKESIKEADQSQTLYAELLNERITRFKWMLKAQEINRELTYLRAEIKKLQTEVETLTVEAIRLKSKELSDKLNISENDILTNEHPEYKGKWVIIKPKD